MRRREHRPHRSRRGRRAGAIVGWRVWRVAVGGSGLVLRSAVYDDVWSPGCELVAACDGGHLAPAPACTCGIYAVVAPAPALRYLVGRNDPHVVHRVLGEVALSGLVVEGEHGWRAARAYPHRVLVPRRQTSGARVDAHAIANALTRYGVSVELLAAHEPASIAAELAPRT